MPTNRPFRSPFSILVLAAVAVAVIVINSNASRRTAPGDTLQDPCEGLSPQACQELMDSRPAEGAQDAGAEWGEAILSAEEACRDVGYLCAEVEANGALRILRWPRDTRVIRVWVPEPGDLPPAVAREFQRAAVRGIQAWHGHPIPLSIRTRASGEEPDITIRWVPTMEEGRLGRAEMEWSRTGEGVEVRIGGFLVATHTPGDLPQELNPQLVELIAAHEMGHALGLPHSDDTRDVMFPQNTATRLTARDFRTVEALYSLPNGAEIRGGSQGP